MTDIIERLQSVQFLSNPEEYDRCAQDAAAEIKRLRDCLTSIRAAVSANDRSALGIAIVATCNNGLREI